MAFPSKGTGSQLGTLRFDQRIALRCEDSEDGFLTADIQSNETQVRAPDEPYFFERFIFTVDRVDDSDVDSVGSSTVAYGQLIRLRHTLTGNYLAVDRKEHATSQRDCLKMMLFSKEDLIGDRFCTFFLRPRYNVRHEGDAVRFSDHVTLVANFENRRRAQRFLHIAPNSKPDSDGEFFEVNCSLSPTAWILHLYDTVQAPITDTSVIQTIRLGTPVVLFQTVIEGYLVAQMSADTFLPTRQESCYTEASMFTADSRADMRLPHETPRKRQNRDNERVKLDRFVSHLLPNEPPMDGVFFQHVAIDSETGSPEGDASSDGSSNSVWVIEGTDPKKGGEVHFHRPYRLRNVSTNLYLGVKKTGTDVVLFLCSENQRDTTVFAFTPVEDTVAGAIQDGASILYIRHVQSGQILHTNRHGPPEGRSETRTPIELSSKVLAQDMFVVSEANAQLAANLQWVLARRRALEFLVQRFANEPTALTTPPFQAAIQAAIVALSGFVLFCTESDDPNPFTREGTPIPGHQRLLLEQSLHKVVVEMLRRPFQSAGKGGAAVSFAHLTEEKHWALQRLCILGYRLLKLMVRGNPENGRQLSQFIPFMQTQLFSPLPVADTVSEIFNGNRRLLEHLTEDLIKCFLGSETQPQNPSYMNFLCQLCVCDGVGIPNNQRIIAAYVAQPKHNRLLPMEFDPIMRRIRISVPPGYMFTEPYESGQNALGMKANSMKKLGTSMRVLKALRSMTMKREGTMKSVSKDAQVTFKLPSSGIGSPSAGSDWKDLKAFCHDEPEAVVAYLRYSLKLLWHLCVGNDPQCVALLQPLVTREMVLSSIGPAHINLPESIRSQFLYLGTHLYLPQCTPGMFPQRHNIVPWSAVEPDGLVVAQPAIDPFAAQLRKAAAATLQAMPHPTDWDPPTTDLAKGALEALVQVVLYKQYIPTELDDVFGRALELLDTQDALDAGGVADAQRLVCCFISNVLDHYLELCLGLVLSAWKRLLQLPEPPAPAPADPAAAFAVALPSPSDRLVAAVGQILTECSSAGLGKGKAEPKPANRPGAKEASGLPEVIQVFQRHLQVHDTALVRMLLRLAAAPDTNLVQDALDLFFRLFDFNSEVCRKVFHAQLLADDRSEAHYTGLRARAAVIKRCQNLQDAAECQEVFECLVAINDDLFAITGLDKHENFQPFLRDGDTVLLPFVEAEAKDKWRAVAGPLREQQGVLHNMGFHQLLVPLLQNAGILIGDPVKLAVLSQANRLLTTFCLQNPRNQRALFDAKGLGVLVELLGMNVSAERCLWALFQDNPDLCEEVQPELVMPLVRQACEAGSQQEWALLLLRSFAVARGQPVTANQEMILLAIMAHGGEIQQRLAEQMEAATERAACGMVELLTLACRGDRNPLRESACEILDLDAVLTMMAQESVGFGLQGQLLRYLAEVWWDTEAYADDPLPTQVDWMQNDLWWRVVENVGRFIELDLVREARTAPPPGHLHMLVHGVLFALAEFFSACWRSDEVDTAHPNATAEVRRLGGLLSGLVTNQAVAQRLQLQPAQFTALERFFQVVVKTAPRYVPLSVWDALEDCRRQGPIVPIDAPAEHAAGKEDSAEKLRTAFRVLQRDIGTAFFSHTVNDMQTVMDSVEQCIDDKLIGALVAFLGRPTVPKPIQLGLLGLFTTMIQRVITQAEEAATNDRTAARQMVIEIQERFLAQGAADCMVRLVERGDDHVTEKAAEFGIALLHGGNTAVQDTLLQLFKSHHSPFFLRLSSLLRGYAASLRQPPTRPNHFSHDAFAVPFALDGWSEVGGRLEYIVPPRPILRLIQLLCEGHHLAMQQLMWSQKNLQPIDMVKEVVDLLMELTPKQMDTDFLTTCLFAFNTLTEFCQGPCDVNQSRVVSCGACGEAIKLLKLELPEHEALLSEVQGAAITMLISLLEGCRDPTRPTMIIRSVEPSTLGVMLGEACNRLQDHQVLWPILEPEQQQTLEVGFNIYVLLQQLLALTGDAALRETLEGSPGASLFASMMSSIEIARGDVVEKVYFRKPANASDLRDDAKSELLRTVDRSAPSAKLMDFVSKSSLLMYELQHQSYVRQLMHDYLPDLRPVDSPSVIVDMYNQMAVPLLHALRIYIIRKIPSHGTRPFEKAALFLAFGVNVLYGMIHTHPELIREHDPFDPDHCASVPFVSAAHYPFILSTVHFLGAGLTMATVGIAASLAALHLPVALRHASAQAGLGDLGAARPTAWRRVRQLVALPWHVKGYCMYVLFLLGACFLGHTVDPVFFSGHTLILIKRSVVVQHIMEAVGRNGRSLLLTALLGVILVYLFTAIGYHMFPQDITGERYQNCVTMFQCFVFSLTSGSRAGGGIGELLPQHCWDSRRHAVRVIYDFAFFLIVPIILLNIVFGIILDTFAQLRTERERVEEDMRASCFICGIPSSTFDRHCKGGFAGHVTVEHNLWDYFFFLQHLELKPQDDYTGQESYVFNKLQRNDISFFPMNMAMGVLQGDAGGDGARDAEALALPEELTRRLAWLEAHLMAQAVGGHSQRNSLQPTTWEVPQRDDSPHGIPSPPLQTLSSPDSSPRAGTGAVARFDQSLALAAARLNAESGVSAVVTPRAFGNNATSFRVTSALRQLSFANAKAIASKQEERDGGPLPAGAMSPGIAGHLFSFSRKHFSFRSGASPPRQATLAADDLPSGYASPLHTAPSGRYSRPRSTSVELALARVPSQKMGSDAIAPNRHAEEAPRPPIVEPKANKLRPDPVVPMQGSQGLPPLKLGSFLRSPQSSTNPHSPRTMPLSVPGSFMSSSVPSPRLLIPPPSGRFTRPKLHRDLSSSGGGKNSFLRPPQRTSFRRLSVAKAVESWDATAVADWLDSIGLGEFRLMFLEEDIDGACLASLVEEDMVDLGLKKGPRIKLRNALRAIVSPAASTPRGGGQAPLTTFSFGSPDDGSPVETISARQITDESVPTPKGKEKEPERDPALPPMGKGRPSPRPPPSPRARIATDMSPASTSIITGVSEVVIDGEGIPWEASELIMDDPPLIIQEPPSVTSPDLHLHKGNRSPSPLWDGPQPESTMYSPSPASLRRFERAMKDVPFFGASDQPDPVITITGLESGRTTTNTDTSRNSSPNPRSPSSQRHSTPPHRQSPAARASPAKITMTKDKDNLPVHLWCRASRLEEELTAMAEQLTREQRTSPPKRRPKRRSTVPKPRGAGSRSSSPAAAPAHGTLSGRRAGLVTPDTKTSPKHATCSPTRSRSKSVK
eukprot:EG_transcript_26